MEDKERKNDNNNWDGLVLKPRKEGKLKKKRKRTQSSLSDKGIESEVQENVMLLKEAQRLRHTTRRSGLSQASKLRGLKQDNHDEESGPANDVAGGLGKAFATERSTHVEEERMSRYVEEKMREKFGDTKPEAQVVDSAKQYEEELYTIPVHLRSTSQRLYDPIEGLPASGVEEVELPEAVRKRNEIATQKAKVALMTQRRRAASERREGEKIVGNVSVNFLQHQKDKRQTAANSTTLAAKDDVGYAQDNESKRELATDAQAVERWRKRWRK